MGSFSKIFFTLLLSININLVTSLNKSLKDIKYVFLESDNTLSIFPYDKNKFETYPIPIILDGVITTLNI